MKTTVEISDALLARARRVAKRTGRPLRALIEEGLRRVVDDAPQAAPFRLVDRSHGAAGDPDPLAEMTWAELRDEIYGGR